MKQATRQHIIETASWLFYSKGYSQTGINEIIEEAGIAKATLYSHFKSKDDLCIAYLVHQNEQLVESMNTIVEQRKKGKAKLLGVLETLIPFFEKEDFNGCWCFRTIAEIPRDNEKIVREIRKQKQELQDYIIKLVVENTTLSKKAQAKLSKRIYLLYEGAIAESHLQKAAWPIHENLELLKELLKK